MDEGLMESNIGHIPAIDIIHYKQYNLHSSLLLSKMINFSLLNIRNVANKIHKLRSFNISEC